MTLKALKERDSLERQVASLRPAMIQKRRTGGRRWGRNRL